MIIENKKAANKVLISPVIHRWPAICSTALHTVFIYLFGFREFTHEAIHNRDIKP